MRDPMTAPEPKAPVRSVATRRLDAEMAYQVAAAHLETPGLGLALLRQARLRGCEATTVSRCDRQYRHALHARGST
jgi:hypothetical protein